MTQPNPPVGYYTPKLGLRVDSLDDEMDSGTSNWDKLDAAQGAIWVAADVTPSDDQLYDGAIVAELVTGKVWRAQKDVNGNYQKKWLKFPWLLVARYDGPIVVTNVAEHEWGYGFVVTAECVNANTSDLVGGRAVAPVDGVYAIVDIMRWESNGSTAGGMRSHRMQINSTTQMEETETIKPPGFNNQAIHQCYYTVNLHAGDTVCGNVWQSAAGPQNNTTHIIYMTCVAPY